MIPNVTRGGRMAGLMNYLVGEGRSNEHTNPTLIAADDRVAFKYESGDALSRYDAFEIAEMLDAPRRAFGVDVKLPEYARSEETGEPLYDESGKKIRVGERDGHVWHCSLSLGPEDGQISHEMWGRIARDFVEQMGFVDPDGAASSRWAAVHHGASKNGNDHIHIVVQLVREDGTKASVHNDRPKAQKVCRGLETEYGLTQLESASAQQRGLSGEKPAEKQRAEQAGVAVSDKFELRRRLRAALATASNAEEYVRHAQDLGVRVAPSFQRGSTSEVRGYKVALSGRQRDGKAVWYAPSKLDSTLGWPDINARFGESGKAAADAYLASLHTSGAARPGSSAKAHDFSAVQIDRMMTRKTGPDTLANIYARLSVQLEKGRHGPLAELSQVYARAAQTNGNSRYAARLNQRFASKNAVQGWTAVMRQAVRLSRVMNQGAMATERRGLGSSADRLLAEAEQIVNKAAQRIQAERPAVAVKAPEQTRGGRDSGYGR